MKPTRTSIFYSGAFLGLLSGLGVFLASPLPAQIRDLALMARGGAAYHSEDYGDAEIYFRRRPSNAAGQAIQQYNLGNALYQQGRYVESLPLYRASQSALGPERRAWAWANMGQAYYQTGQVRQSYAAYCRALVLAPHDQSIRQDFLFLWHRLHPHRKNQRPARPGAASRPSAEEASGAQVPQESQSPGSSPEEVSTAQLSPRNIEEIMGLIAESENRVRERMNTSRQKGRKAASDEQDY